MSIIFNAKTGLKSIRRAANTPSANDPGLNQGRNDHHDPDLNRDVLADMGAGIWWCVLYSLCAFLVFAVVVVAAK
jgi:hypothetical protein